MKIQTMSFGLPEGGHVLMHWPDCIEPESVDMLLECVTLQCKAMRRAAEIAKDERGKATNEEAPNAMRTASGERTAHTKEQA